MSEKSALVVTPVPADLTTQTREQLLDLRDKVQTDADNLKAKIAEAKRTGAARGRYVPAGWLMEREEALRERGRMMQRIQTQIARLNKERHEKEQDARIPKHDDWDETTKIAHNLWLRATAIRLASEPTGSKDLWRRCFEEAVQHQKNRVQEREANMTPEQAEMWRGVLEAQDGELALE